MTDGTTLRDVLGGLRKVAPESYGASWDKVGLHLGRIEQTVRRALLTIDLTEPVVAEAIERDAELIVAYHPPIFSPLASLIESGPGSHWKSRLVATAIRHSIAVYSPHTALDAAPGGINDWLAEAVAGREWVVDEGTLETRPFARRVELNTALDTETVVARIRERLGIHQVRYAAPLDGRDDGRWIRTVGLCAGSGGSTFEEIPECDLYFTGEMQHHGVLDRISRGSGVVLTGHTLTERPYLPVYQQTLTAQADNRVEWLVSRSDTAPWTTLPP